MKIKSLLVFTFLVVSTFVLKGQNNQAFVTSVLQDVYTGQVNWTSSTTYAKANKSQFINALKASAYTEDQKRAIQTALKPILDHKTFRSYSVTNLTLKSGAQVNSFLIGIPKDLKGKFSGSFCMMVLDPKNQKSVAEMIGKNTKVFERFCDYRKCIASFGQKGYCDTVAGFSINGICPPNECRFEGEQCRSKSNIPGGANVTPPEFKSPGDIFRL